MNVRGGKFPVGYSRIFRSILHPEGMKHTGNQKVVTAAKWLLLQFSGKYRPIRQNPFVKALSAPYRACTALPDKKPPTPLQSKIGAYGVSLFTDFKSGNYRRGLSSNFRVGSNQIPLCSSQKRKAIFPRKIGVMSIRVQICSRKIPGTVATGGYALQGYISNRTFKGRNSLFSGSALFM